MTATKTKKTPSRFALSLLKGMRKAASEEVRKHLEAGRTVHGLFNGEPVEIRPKKS
jgi:precorrin-2 methylase